MAVATTRRVGTHRLWEFQEPIEQGVVEVDQSLDDIGWVVDLLVLDVAEAAFSPLLWLFLMIYVGGDLR